MAETPERHAEPAHAAAVGLRPGPQGDAPVLPQREVPRDHRPGPRARSPTRRSPPTSSSASRARPRRTSRTRSTSCARRGSPARSPSSTPSVPARRPRRMPDQVPKAVVQERYDRLIAAPGGGLLGREPARSRAREVEVLVATGEGRKDAATAPPVGSGPRQPARPLRRARRRRARRARATSSPSASPTARRTTSSPTAARPAARTRSVGPPAATPGPRCRTHRAGPSRACRSVCRRSASACPARCTAAPARTADRPACHDRCPGSPFRPVPVESSLSRRSTSAIEPSSWPAT